MHSKSSALSQTVLTPMSSEQAANLVKQLLGCYPSLSLHNPEVYITAMTALLSGFSLWVGQRAIAEVSKTAKFVPSVAEVSEACERHAPAKDTRTWVDEWEWRAKLQLEDRARAEAPAAPDERKRIEQGFADLLAHLRRDRRQENEFTPEAVKAKFGISDAQWDAIPDSPLKNWKMLGEAAE